MTGKAILTSHPFQKRDFWLQLPKANFQGMCEDRCFSWSNTHEPNKIDTEPQNIHGGSLEKFCMFPDLTVMPWDHEKCLKGKSYHWQSKFKLTIQSISDFLPQTLNSPCRKKLISGILSLSTLFPTQVSLQEHRESHISPIQPLVLPSADVRDFREKWKARTEQCKDRYGVMVK